MSRDRVFEALNALAFVSAVTLGGARDEAGKAREFFEAALEKNLATITSERES